MPCQIPRHRPHRLSGLDGGGGVEIVLTPRVGVGASSPRPRSTTRLIPSPWGYWCLGPWGPARPRGSEQRLSGPRGRSECRRRRTSPGVVAARAWYALRCTLRRRGLWGGLLQQKDEKRNACGTTSGARPRSSGTEQDAKTSASFGEHGRRWLCLVDQRRPSLRREDLRSAGRARVATGALQTAPACPAELMIVAGQHPRLPS